MKFKAAAPLVVTALIAALSLSACGGGRGSGFGRFGLIVLEREDEARGHDHGGHDGQVLEVLHVGFYVRDLD